MRKSRFLKEIMNRVMLVGIIGFVSVSVSLAQETIAEKIDYAKALFGGYMSSSKEEQESKVIGFYEKCSKEQQEAILSYMVQAITDSLKADNKLFAMNYIDNYRLIANPDDSYLGSLVITEGRYYYEQMDALKLSELSDYLNEVTANSKLDYSSELSELNRMKEEVVTGCQNIEGYWVADFGDKEKADPFYLYISKDDTGEYHVKTEYSTTITMAYTDMLRYKNQTVSISQPFYFSNEQQSSECVRTSPNTLSYIWSSEKLNVGKEGLTSFLRSEVRTISNSIIGEMARSNSHSIGTSIGGSIGAIAGEIMLNSLIDMLSISKKKIWTIRGVLTPIDKNNIDATLFFDIFALRSDNSGVDEKHLDLDVKLVRCQWDAPVIKNNIAFAEGSGNLRQASFLSKSERKIFYKSNHKARSIVRRTNWAPYSFVNNRTIRKYNRKQLEKLKEYNLSH